MRIIVASGNQHKIEEIKSILNDLAIEVVSVYDVLDSYVEPVEDGDTFEANALIKSKSVKQYFEHDMVLADDSGLMVDALNGEPGVRSARYAGEEHDDKKNNALLIKNLQGVKKEQRKAKFVSVLSLIDEYNHEYFFRGEIEGQILFEALGDSGFGYDPYFRPLDSLKTFAQMSSEEKNSDSHRKRALDKLKQHLMAKGK